MSNIGVSTKTVQFSVSRANKKGSYIGRVTSWNKAYTQKHNKKQILFNSLIPLEYRSSETKCAGNENRLKMHFQRKTYISEIRLREIAIRK